MPLRDAVALFDYWQQWPPAHVLLRGFVGYEPPRRLEDIPMDAKKALAPVSGGTSKKISEAPTHVRAIIERMKKGSNG